MVMLLMDTPLRLHADNNIFVVIKLIWIVSLMLTIRWSINENMYLILFGANNSKEVAFLPYIWENAMQYFSVRFVNKLSSNVIQSLSVIDIGYMKSSGDAVHWQQGKHWIYSCQF